VPGPGGGGGEGRQPIREVKARHEGRLLGVDSVQGVGIGEERGRPVITVYVAGPTEALRRAIPPELEGYPVRVVVSGELRALGDPQAGGS
jgi:hypothetical protein